VGCIERHQQSPLDAVCGSCDTGHGPAASWSTGRSAPSSTTILETRATTAGGLPPSRECTFEEPLVNVSTTKRCRLSFRPDALPGGLFFYNTRAAPAGAVRPSGRELGVLSSLLVCSVAPALGLAASVAIEDATIVGSAQDDGSAAVHWAELVQPRTRKVPLSCSVMTFLTANQGGRLLEGASGRPGSNAGWARGARWRASLGQR
jgi:hypothetical protein